MWSILVCKIPQFLAKSYRFGQLIILFQKVDTLRLLKIHNIFSLPAGAKYPFFQAPAHGLKCFLQNYLFFKFNVISFLSVKISFRRILYLFKCKQTHLSLLFNSIGMILVQLNLTQFIIELDFLYITFNKPGDIGFFIYC